MAELNFLPLTQKIKQGEDKFLAFRFEDENCNPIDLTQASIVVLLKNGETELYKYSLPEQEGYGTLEILGSGSEFVRITIERNQSKDFIVGNANAYVIASFPDDHFDSRTEERSFLSVLTVSEGIGKDEVMPELPSPPPPPEP